VHVAVECEPAAQMSPHPPQFDGDASKSTHAPVQFVFGGVHVATHDPASHFALPQAFVHVPQCVGRDKSASQPFDGSPSQSPHPDSQLPTAHALAAHVHVVCCTEAKQGVHVVAPQP
jgi:hypothetical protein